jgi:hypothetical protein
VFVRGISLQHHFNSVCQADGKLLPVCAWLQRLCRHDSLSWCYIEEDTASSFVDGHLHLFSLGWIADCDRSSGRSIIILIPNICTASAVSNTSEAFNRAPPTPESRCTLRTTHMSSMNSQTACSPISASARDPHFHSY